MRTFKSVIILLFVFAISLSAKQDKKMRLAILDLVPQKVNKSTSAMVSDILRTELFNTGLFRIIERNEMKSILKEQEFQISGCIDTECAVKVGKLISANKILIGSLGKLGKRYIINIRIVDIEKGEVEFAEKASANSEDDLDSTVNNLVIKTTMKIYGIKKKTGNSIDSFKKNLSLKIKKGIISGKSHGPILGINGDEVTSIHNTRSYVMVWKILPEFAGPGKYYASMKHAVMGNRGSFYITAWADTNNDGIPDKKIGQSEKKRLKKDKEWSSWVFNSKYKNIFVGFAADNLDTVLYYQMRGALENYTGLSKTVYYTKKPNRSPKSKTSPRFTNIRVSNILK